MRHLGERITDYIFEELSPADMAEARDHVAQCADCRRDVDIFQRTHSLLKASPDVNPPRSVVFEFEKPAASRFWKWAAPMAAAAMLLLTVALMAPMQVRWNDSQLVIAFGQLPETQPPAPVAAPASAPVERVVAEPVDYARIEKWVSDELSKRDVAQRKEIQRLQGQLAYLEGLQLATERNLMATDSSIQLLASRGSSEE